MKKENNNSALDFKFLTGVIKRKPPRGTICVKCGSKKLTIYTTLFSGSYSGRLECDKCGYSMSVMSYIGKHIVTIESLKKEDIK
jgi:hypothetical protein